MRSGVETIGITAARRRRPCTFVLAWLSRRGPSLESEVIEALRGVVAERQVRKALGDLLRGGIVELQPRTFRAVDRNGDHPAIVPLEANCYAIRPPEARR